MTGEFTVTRQIQWPGGDRVVEISQGGIDYTNPGALSPQFEGEFETFVGLTPAVKAAFAIAHQWKNGRVAVGHTHGMTMPFEDGVRANRRGFVKLMKQAVAFDAKLERCVECGDILPDVDKRWGVFGWDGECNCCSEYCADERCRSYMREIEEEEVTSE